MHYTTLHAGTVSSLLSNLVDEARGLINTENTISGSNPGLECLLIPLSLDHVAGSLVSPSQVLLPPDILHPICSDNAIHYLFCRCSVAVPIRMEQKMPRGLLSITERISEKSAYPRKQVIYQRP